MRGRAARWIAFAALLALVVPILFLAGGLPGTKFSDGRPFDEQEVARPSRALSGQSTMRPLDYWLSYTPAIALIVAAVTYAALKLRGRAAVRRRSSIFQLVALGLVMIALAFVARQQMMKNATLQDVDAELEEASETAASATTGAFAAPEERLPSAGESDAQATSLLLQIFFAVLALAASAGLAVAIARMRTRRPRGKMTPQPEDLLAPLDTALARLRQGRDAAGVVEECYRDMMAALAKALDVDPRAMTPREFAAAVAGLGWGETAVAELTDLFELVRYGRRPDAPLAVRAQACMTRLRDQLATVGAGA